MPIAPPLPAALYAGAEAFQRERRSIFASAWLMLARADQVREPGQYIAQSLGGWPIFAIVDDSGRKSGFRNVCRHQGLPIFDTGSGRCAEIRCRYHGWSYDASGCFRGAPPQSAPADVADPLHNLQRIATAEICGQLFVHLGEATGAPALPVLAAADVERFAFSGESVSDIDANWKLVVEAMLRTAPSAGSRAFEWPALVADAMPDAAVVHQIIPRAFQRTRIQHHRYGGAEAPEIAAVREAAVAAQAALTQAVEMPPDENAAVAAFRERIRRAHLAN